MSTDIKSAQFQAAFLRDVTTRANGPPLKLEIDVGAAITLIAQLQLALRHPGNSGHSATLTEGFVRHLIKAVADTDTLRRGLMAGFDPNQDREPATQEDRAAWFRAWYLAMPESWRTGMWDALLDGAAWMGDLPPNPAAGLRGLSVFFMPAELGERVLAAIERGELR